MLGRSLQPSGPLVSPIDPPNRFWGSKNNRDPAILPLLPCPHAAALVAGHEHHLTLPARVPIPPPPSPLPLCARTEAYVRVDAAFVPLHRSLDTSIITPELRGLGAMGQPCAVSLHDAIGSLINRPVCKIGATSGVTHGRIMGYAVEYNDNRSRTLFTDFLILGEQGQPFDQEGDSGSLILAMPNREGDSTDGRDHTDGDNVLRPIGVIWGGTANRGRLKLRRGHVPENWTSAVDVGRLLRLLDLRMITTSEELR
ncbi:unnamed protein product, partial [Closterium sp. NIES-53]